MAQDRESEINEVAAKVVQRLASALAAGSGGSGFHCTGVGFECGTYDCIAAVHSCTGVYKCTIKFTELTSRAF